MGLLLFLPLLLTVLPQIMAGKQELQAVVQGNSLFTQQLYNALATAAQPQENIFFSPISAHAALSMAYQGAKGTTHDAFTKILGIKDHGTAATGYHDVMQHLNNVQNVTLHLANKIYVNAGSALKENFKGVTKNSFLSEVESIEFGKNVAAAASINSWVEQKTNNKIHDLVQADDLSEDTRLVLVNAIYFKGNWKLKFNKADTKTEKFYLNDNDSVDVQMMFKKEKFNYKEDAALDAKVLELPYANDDLSLIVVLPNKRNGIADLEKKLAGYDLTKITEGMYQPEVLVHLPKFKIETKMDLGDALVKMGLGVAFNDTADFSDMLDNSEAIKISKVVQKAFIEVNEEGSEAAAATAMVIRARIARVRERPPASFTADHPCIILVQKKQQQRRRRKNLKRTLILFAGRLSNIKLNN